MTKDRKADRYAARFIQSLPYVLPVAGGDKGQYPSGGAGQTPWRGQQHHRGSLRPQTIVSQHWSGSIRAATPPHRPLRTIFSHGGAAPGRWLTPWSSGSMAALSNHRRRR